MHNRSYNEQDAIQRLLLFEEGLSRLIELMKIEKKDVLRGGCRPSGYLAVIHIEVRKKDHAEIKKGNGKI